MRQKLDIGWIEITWPAPAAHAPSPTLI